jgi:hypothetical protein
LSSPKPSLNTLEARKQLLVAEAEVLRARMGKDMKIIQQGFTVVGTQAKSIASFASIAAIVVAGFSAFRGARKIQSKGKSSLISKLFTGVRAASTVWLALRSRQR